MEWGAATIGGRGEWMTGPLGVGQAGLARRLGADGRVRWTRLALGALILTLLVGLWVRGEGSRLASVRAFPTTTGTLTVPGLSRSVDVHRDANGIPHIEAVLELDAYAAMGFVHAQDRLGQMLWMRRLAQGRTAEWIGSRGLDSDRMARTLGLAHHAGRELERLPASTLGILEAYSAGVNARLARVRSGEVAQPLILAGFETDYADWRPVDSLTLLKLIAWSTGNLLETVIVLDDLLERVDSVLARPFRPTGRGIEGVEIPPSMPNRDVFAEGAAPPENELLSPGRELVSSTAIRGGTAFALGGELTRSGSPILVADLHLPATIPSLVYETHFRGGRVDVAGVSIPGMPVVWLGRNLHLSWAAIPARAVTVDIYKEIVRESAGLYQNGSRWVPLEERAEVIRHRDATGQWVEETLMVRSTHHGPLINPLLRASSPSPQETDAAAQTPPVGTMGPPGGVGASAKAPAERGPLALAWTGAVPGDGMTSLLDLARGRTSEALIDALASHHEPVLSVVYADDRGHVGMQLAGWLPARRLASGLALMPGRMRGYDWRGRIDYTALPALHRPPGKDPTGRGWVISADGSLDDGLTDINVDWLWRTGERTRRLETRLADTYAERGHFDLRSAAAIQIDRHTDVAERVIPALLRLAQREGTLRPEAREIAQLIQRWDGDVSAESRGAAAYHVLMEHLVEGLFAEPFGDALYQRYLALPGVRPDAVVERLIVEAERLEMAGGWTDVERVSAVVRAALRHTWVSLVGRLGPDRDAWRWGGLHRIGFRPFAAGLGADRGLATELVPTGGDATSIAMTSHPLGQVRGRDRASAYRVDAAATYRLAVDLGDRDGMLSALAPGQSEHPRHAHYRSGIEGWLEGRARVLATSALLVNESRDHLLLEPAP